MNSLVHHFQGAAGINDFDVDNERQATADGLRHSETKPTSYSGCQAVKRLTHATAAQPSSVEDGLTSQPHHKLIYSFPDLSLLKGDEQWVLLEPFKSDLRYEPKDTKIEEGHYNIISSGLGDIAYKHISTGEKCDRCATKASHIFLNPFSTTSANLSFPERVLLVTKYVGVSHISIVCHETPGKPGIRVRVRMTTTLLSTVCPELNGHSEKVEYNYSLALWNRFFFDYLQNSSHEGEWDWMPSNFWMHTLAVLMMRADPCSYLAVKHYIERQLAETPDFKAVVAPNHSAIEWYKHEPYDDIKEGMRKTTVPADADPRDKYCQCGDPFKLDGTGDTDAEPTTEESDIPVSPWKPQTCEHPICLSCARTWQVSCRPKVVTCPTCRRPLLGDLFLLNDVSIWDPRSHAAFVEFNSMNLQGERDAEIDGWCCNFQRGNQGIQPPRRFTCPRYAEFDHQGGPADFYGGDYRIKLDGKVISQHFAKHVRLLYMQRPEETRTADDLWAIWLAERPNMFDGNLQMRLNENRRIRKFRPRIYLASGDTSRDPLTIPDGQMAMRSLYKAIQHFDGVVMHPRCLQNALRNYIAWEMWDLSDPGCPIDPHVNKIVSACSIVPDGHNRLPYHDAICKRVMAYMRRHPEESADLAYLNTGQAEVTDQLVEFPEVDPAFDSFVDYMLKCTVEFARRLETQGDGYFEHVWGDSPEED